MNNNKTVNICILGFLVSVGLLLRIYKWNTYSFWHDEALWVLISKHFSNIRDGSVFSLRPPLIYVLLFFWQKLSTNEFILRLPSVIFGAMSIVLAFKTAKLIFTDKVALVAAFFVTFSPLHIYYAQELNYYTLTVLFSLASMYFLISSLQKDEWHLWAKYAAWTIACLYTNYLCLFLLLSQNIIFILYCFRDRRIIRKWLASQGIILIFSLPVLHLFLGSISFMQQSDPDIVNWFPRGNWEHVVQTFNVFNLGYNATRFTSKIGFIVFFLLFLYGIVRNLDKKEVLLLFLAWLSVPIIASLAAGKILHINTYTHRNFICSSLPYYILIASGIGKLKNRYLIPALLAVVLLLYSPMANYYRNVIFVPEGLFRPGVHLKADYREATNYIVDNFKDGDAIVHLSRSSDLPFFYYASSSSKRPIRELVESYYGPFTGKMSLKELIRDYLANKSHIIRSKNDIKDFVAGHTRLWFVFSDWEPESLASMDSEKRKIKISLDQLYPLIKEEKFEGLAVYLYDTT